MSLGSARAGRDAKYHILTDRDMGSEKVQEQLQFLWNAEKMPLSLQCRLLDDLKKNCGDDEKLWQAEFEKLQGKVTARGVCFRKIADNATPRMFREHALEYMAKLESTSAAFDILVDISAGRRCSSNQFSERLHQEVIMKNVCFQALQDFKAFKKWREPLASTVSNKRLLILFITKNGTHEEKARMHAIKYKKARAVTQRVDAYLGVLADACCSVAGATGDEGGAGAEAGAGRKKRGIDAEGGGLGSRLKKRTARDRADVQHKSRPPGKERKRQRTVQTVVAASPRQPVPLKDGITCSSCDTPAAYACVCTRTKFCTYCSSYSNYCDLCHASFEGCQSSQSKCSSCYNDFGTEEDIITCGSCKIEYCDDCDGTIDKRRQCVRCAGTARFIEYRCKSVTASAAQVETGMKMSSNSRPLQKKIVTFAQTMCHLGRTGCFEQFSLHLELLRRGLAWQGHNSKKITLSPSEIAHMHVPIQEHLKFVQEVSVASAKEAARLSARSALAAGCGHLAELTGDQVNVALLLYDSDDLHPLMDMVSESLMRLDALKTEFKLMLTLVLLRPAMGKRAQALALHYKDNARLLDCSAMDSDKKLLETLRAEQFHLCLDLVSLAHGNRPAVMQNRFCHRNIHYLNYPNPAFDKEAYSHVVLSRSMAAAVDVDSAECLAVLGGPWLNVQHPELMAGVNRDKQCPATGTFRVIVIGPAHRLGPEGILELFDIVLATMEHNISFGLYRFNRIPFGIIIKTAQDFARSHDIAEERFVSRLLPYDYKGKANHLNRLREEYHLGLILSSVYPPHTNGCDCLVSGLPVAVAGEFMTKTCAGSAVYDMMLFAGLGALVSKNREQLVDFFQQFIRDHTENKGTLLKGIRLCMDHAACNAIGFWNQDRLSRNLAHILRSAADDLWQGHVRPLECPVDESNPSCVELRADGQLVLVERVAGEARMWHLQGGHLLPTEDAMVMKPSGESLQIEDVLTRAVWECAKTSNRFARRIVCVVLICSS